MPIGFLRDEGRVLARVGLGRVHGRLAEGHDGGEGRPRLRGLHAHGVGVHDVDLVDGRGSSSWRRQLPVFTRSRLNFTDSALNSSPLWNLTPRRSFTSHVVGATSFGQLRGERGHDLEVPIALHAACRRGGAATTDAGVSCWFMVSSVVGSTPCAMTTLPSGAAAGQAAGATSRRASSERTHETLLTTIGGASSRERPKCWQGVASLRRCQAGPSAGAPAGRERLLTRGHQPEGLGLARAGEQTAHLGARRAARRRP